MSHDDLVAQFLAKGGQIAKIAEGETALNLSSSQWRREVSKPGTIQSRSREQDSTRENAYHKAHDAHFVGDHDEGYRIMDEEG